MKKWLIMVFMAGDNNLEHAARSDLFKMLMVGSSDQVDVVVQMDSFKDGASRYYIEPGHLKQAYKPLGATNTGDPAILADFICWARQSHAAEHTMLVIWGHGTGWETVSANFNWNSIRGRKWHGLNSSIFATTVRKGYEQANGARAIALDTSSRDFLDVQELQQALVMGLQGDKLDIIGFDACLMGMIEIAYQLRNQACYMIASQEAEPILGWPYEALLDTLHEQLDVSPRDLCAIIVHAYGQIGARWRSSTKYTQAAYDLAKMNQAAEMIEQLTTLLLADYPAQLHLRRAVDEASGKYRGAKGAKRFRDANSIDLVDWLQKVKQVYVNHESELIEILDIILLHLIPETSTGLILANSAEVGNDRDQVYGISIYLPHKNIYSNLYHDLEFAVTRWGEIAKLVSKMHEQ